MSLRVVLRPEAQADLLETRDWYEQQELGLGMAFADSVDEAVARIEAMLQMYAMFVPGCAPGKTAEVSLSNLVSCPIGSK
jgi:hypothetical protein